MKFEATPTYRFLANNSLHGKTHINSNGKKKIETHQNWRLKLVKLQSKNMIEHIG